MESTTNLHDWEEFEDNLSFCDLPLHNQDTEPSTSSDEKDPSSLSNQEPFDFPTTSSSKTNLTLDNIIFCGKIIPHKTEEPANPFDDQRNSLFGNRSSSFDLRTFKPSSTLQATRSFRQQRSGNPKKHKVLIGLARIPQKMELTDIKKRQSRRVPPPMFPEVVVGEEKPVVTGKGSRRKDHWGVVRSLRCMNYLASALAKASFGHIALV